MSPRNIDVERLLQPIGADAPTGLDPRADTSPQSRYYRIKDARNAARAAERGATDIDGPIPDEWDIVVALSRDLLETQAKDLEVACWLTEGLVRRNGFYGLRDGLDLLSALVDRYFETCYPILDEDDGIEGRVSSIAGLAGGGGVGTLIQPLRLVPITSGSQNSYSHYHFEQANDLEKITDTNKKQARIDAGAVSMADFTRSVLETAGEFFAELTLVLGQCLDAIRRTSNALDAAAGRDAPPLTALRSLIEDVDGAVRFFAKDKLAVAQSRSDGTADTAPTAIDTQGSAASPPAAGHASRRLGEYGSREEALAELSRIAAHFRRTEPHSPIAYTLEDAVRRARMTLPELLGELLEDATQVDTILRNAGIKPLASGE